MRLACAPLSHALLQSSGHDVEVVLFAQADRPGMASVGAALADDVRRSGLLPSPRAWDLLSIALSAVTADVVAKRDTSTDGWTRDIELDIAVTEPSFWESQRSLLEATLKFLTTDRWVVHFVGEGATPPRPRRIIRPAEDSVVLLSGGMDSLVGTIDLTAQGKKLLAVSQVASGDGDHQRQFARDIGGGLRHLQLNHNAHSPSTAERSQRARSLAFLAYGVLAASSLRSYQVGATVTLFACENGFISMNPPLTAGRLGSLSTRTTHPVFIRRFQNLLDSAGLRVHIENPYQFSTKGEMLLGCADQTLLKARAHRATSCGRYARHGFKHCGRCVPCLVRRASFKKWGIPDRTTYVYRDLAQDDDDHARYDDVRSVVVALSAAKRDGSEAFVGASLSALGAGDISAHCHVVERGFAELELLMTRLRVR